MRYFAKKVYFIVVSISIACFCTLAFGKDNVTKYSRGNVSNYLSGIISAEQNENNKAYKYLNKIQPLKEEHSNFDIQFVRTLVQLEKFEDAFNFLKTKKKEQLFFEGDLLLGLHYFTNKDYSKAEEHFKKLNTISRYNFLFDNFLSNILISWVRASNQDIKGSLESMSKISKRYGNLVRIHAALLNCHFDSPQTYSEFKKLVEYKNNLFSRYNFFFANYLLFKNKRDEAAKLISKSRQLNSGNLLIRQTENFILNKKIKKIKKIFNCKHSRDNMAEIFYVIANMYSNQKYYKVSNFYLKISFFLNNKFTPNKVLLAENLYNMKKYKQSKEVYDFLKNIGSVYSWHADLSNGVILSGSDDLERAVYNLEKNLDQIANPSFEHYYQLANFYKDNKYYKDSIKYYSLALDNISEDHPLIPKILDRRGTSYEREGDWAKAEKDLLASLEISPEQPYVLNYLAYSWVEKNMNVEKAMEMLKRAVELKKNDGYITDSLGWAYFAQKDYINAEKFLRQALELMPFDPVINDHYADVLWMLNKDIQARYFWKHVLSLDKAEEKIKDNVNQKLIFGIRKEL